MGEQKVKDATSPKLDMSSRKLMEYPQSTHPTQVYLGTLYIHRESGVDTKQNLKGQVPAIGRCFLQA